MEHPPCTAIWPVLSELDTLPLCVPTECLGGMREVCVHQECVHQECVHTAAPFLNSPGAHQHRDIEMATAGPQLGHSVSSSTREVETGGSLEQSRSLQHSKFKASLSCRRLGPEEKMQDE